MKSGSYEARKLSGKPYGDMDAFFGVKPDAPSLSGLFLTNARVANNNRAPFSNVTPLPDVGARGMTSKMLTTSVSQPALNASIQGNVITVSSAAQTIDRYAGFDSAPQNMRTQFLLGASRPVMAANRNGNYMNYPVYNGIQAEPAPRVTPIVVRMPPRKDKDGANKDDGMMMLLFASDQPDVTFGPMQERYFSFNRHNSARDVGVRRGQIIDIDPVTGEPIRQPLRQMGAQGVELTAEASEGLTRKVTEALADSGRGIVHTTAHAVKVNALVNAAIDVPFVAYDLYNGSSVNDALKNNDTYRAAVNGNVDELAMQGGTALASAGTFAAVAAVATFIPGVNLGFWGVVLVGSAATLAIDAGARYVARNVFDMKDVEASTVEVLASIPYSEVADVAQMAYNSSYQMTGSHVQAAKHTLQMAAPFMGHAG